MDEMSRGPQNTNAAEEVEVPSPEIDRSIYVMPAFATLRVRDLDASRRWYVEGLGFIVLAELPGPSGETALMHLRRWRYQDILLAPAHDPDIPTASGIRLTFSAHGTDLDALAAQAHATGGGVVEGPFATPWNTRDLVARDPDGYEVALTSWLPPDQRDSEFSSRMEQVRERIRTEGEATPGGASPGL